MFLLDVFIGWVRYLSLDPMSLDPIRPNAGPLVLVLRLFASLLALLRFLQHCYLLQGFFA